MKNEIITERIGRLREAMDQAAIDIYVIPTADYHNSEYVGDYFKVREYFSGFTGSNGTLVVTKQEAGLWTDGRYFIQAEKELAGTSITLYRMGDEGVPTIAEYIDRYVGTNQVSTVVLGFDGRVCSSDYVEKLTKYCKDKITIKYQTDLADGVWTDRPKRACEKVFSLPDSVTGEKASEKIARVREQMRKEQASCFLLSRLDDIMWLYNMRGQDVECNPVALAYTFLTEKEQYLFLQEEALTENFKQYLQEYNIIIRAYDSIFSFLAEYDYQGNVLIDPYDTSYQAKQIIQKHTNIILSKNPTEDLKAIKNKVELSVMQHYYELDSAAVCKFICWLKKGLTVDLNAAQEQCREGEDRCREGEDRCREEQEQMFCQNEREAARYLDALRAKIDGFMGLSFPTISAYGANAAMMHYEADEKNSTVLKRQGMLLVDSGGQYLGATTDVTRTICLGPVTEEEKMYFTLVACGMLRLMNASFLSGCSGRNLDILAREPLWKRNVDYKCGTGHGVGAFLNVHEGPQGIRWKYVPGAAEAVLKEGMLVTDEPGVYIEGKFGIRTENVLLVREGEKNDDGQFLHFDTLTYVPIDLEAIDVQFMNEDDRNMLNQYHKMVYEKMAPYLDEKEEKWLKNATRMI